MKRVTLQGIGASPGIAVAPARLFVRSDGSEPEKAVLPASAVEAEVRRLQAALAKGRQELTALHDRVARETGTEEAAIFEAQLLMLDDPGFSGRAEELVRTERAPAEWAVWKAAQEASAALAALPDEYLRARAADVLDVGRRVKTALAALGGGGDSPARTEERPSDGRVSPPGVQPAGPVVIVSRELTPSDTAGLDRARVAGFVTEAGSRTSHAAILARSMGIPAVVGAPGAVEAVADGDTVIVDGDAGTVIVRPSADEERLWRARRTERLAVETRRREAAGAGPALTADGRRVEVAANIGSPGDVQAALANGAEGVGLFRTEFLFLDRDSAPDEEEQYAAYRAVAEAFGERPVVIRTLDIGGDKDIPWLGLEKEANSFLGQRGLRLCLARPEMFLTQLRAILRARAAGNVWVMFPMVADVGEARAARELVARAAAELRGRGAAYRPELPVGVMVETPAAALLAGALLDEVDFVSLGTNDLTQYTLAADRTNPRVAGIWDDLHPAVLRLIAMTADAARERGKWVGVCGGLAGERLAVPVLVGLGVRELSAAVPDIPAVKEAVRAVTTTAAEKLAKAALACRTAAEVRRLLEQEVQEPS